MVFGCKAVWLAIFVWTGGGLEPPADQLGCLAWMKGAWVSSSERGSSEEVWTAPAGGLMLGLHRDVFHSGKTFFEYLRIQQSEDAVHYYASPQGREATAFRLVECREGFALFENPEHDFPQKITYWLKPDGGLCATAAGVVDGKPRQSTWCWQPEKP